MPDLQAANGKKAYAFDRHDELVIQLEESKHLAMEADQELQKAQEEFNDAQKAQQEASGGCSSVPKEQAQPQPQDTTQAMEQLCGSLAQEGAAALVLGPHRPTMSCLVACPAGR